jgi:hypothetical protein
MKAVLARTSPALEPPPPETPAAKKKTAAGKLPVQSPVVTLILNNFQAEDFRKLLGINLFEDTVWFNKESFEEVLFYAPLFIALESGAALEAVSRPPEKPAEKAKAALPKPSTAKLPAEAPTPALAGDDWLARVAEIGAITEALTKAEAKSGYRLDGLLDALGTEVLSEKVKGKGEKSAP